MVEEKKTMTPAQKKGCFIALGIILLLILSRVWCVAITSQPTKPDPAQVGATSYLAAHNDPGGVLAAVDRTSYNAMSKALVARDDIGLGKLAAAGLVVAIPRNTQVKVIDSEFGIRQVRVLTGELYGRTFWVLKEVIVAEALGMRWNAPR